MHPSLMILLVGLLYLLGFGALSYMRRQGLSARFAIEGLILTAIGAALTLTSVPLHPILFLSILYLITMRVRLLVDLANWFTTRKRYEQALNIYRFAQRLKPDVASRQIVLINRGVAELRMQDPEAARLTLKEALIDESARPGARYLAAGYYNLGLASRRTGREAEAIRHFNEAIDAFPNSIYAQAARRELKEGKPPAPEI
jgi:tetratricopeptide (TPR) repeat protein